MTRLIAIVGLILTTSTVLAQDTVNAGKATWAPGYPKVVDGGVEILGDVEPEPGWKVTKVTASAAPEEGGQLDEPTELKFINGMWGKLDPKDKSKIIPVKYPLAKGRWRIFITLTFEKKGEAPILYGVMTAYVEVK